MSDENEPREWRETREAYLKARAQAGPWRVLLTPGGWRRCCQRRRQPNSLVCIASASTRIWRERSPVNCSWIAGEAAGGGAPC
jgi:hypothetical protein